MLGQWMNTHIKNKLFNKIIIFYSIISIFFITCLAYLSIYILNENKTKEIMNANASLVEEMHYLLNHKYTSSQNILQTLYVNHSARDAILAFLEIGNPEFIQYSLDSYFKHDTSHFSNLKNYLRTAFEHDRDIESILLYSFNQSFIYSFNKNMNAYYYNNQTPTFIRYEKALNDYPLHHNTIVATDLWIKDKSQDTFSVILNIKDPDSIRSLGKLIINYSKRNFYSSYLDNTSKLDVGDIVILTEDEQVLLDSTEDFHSTIASKLHLLHTNQHDYALVSLKTASYVKSIYHDAFKVTILGIVPKKIVTGGTKSTRLLIATAVIICVLAIIGSTLLFTTSYSNRLRMITSAIKKVRKGDLSVRIKIQDKKDELTQIGLNFNKMCDDLNDYIEKVYIYQVQQKSAELASLQSQINPHFLYNTLESIRMRAAVKGALDVSEMIYILASFFRNSLKTDTITTIGHEIEHCQLYLKLFQIRYGKKLSVHFHMNEATLAYSIVKLSIQPIVENYIVHGIDLDALDNQVTLSSRLENQTIFIDIEDNGKGIRQDVLQSIQSTLNQELNPKSIGLFNVHERLKMVYGSTYGLSIDSKEQVGTKVTLCIPAIKKGDIKNV